VFFAASAAGQLLLGGTGPTPRPPPPLDPRLPTGADVSISERPEEAREPPACSFTRPVCVHRAPKVPEQLVFSWLASLETAYDRLVFGLGLPAPLPDGDRGGNSFLDVYLTADGAPVRVELDRLTVGAAYDSASAYCVAGANELAVARAATLCFGEAVAFALDASETPFSRRALAEELWLASGSPTSADVRAIDDVQAAPERAIVARDASPLAEGGGLFLEYLDRAKGRGEPAGVPVATYVLSGRGSSPVGLRFTNEPDTLDVLRTTFGGTPSDTARFFGDFAVARAFQGARDANGEWPGLDFAGSAGRVRFEWSVPFSSLPRHLVPARPVEPTGSSYLWVSLDGANDASLVFEADWEPPVAFKWMLVVVAPDGRELRRVDVPFLERGTHVERTVSDLRGAKGVLVAGTNLGGLGPSYPFDPDFEPFEPHAYAVYLAAR
jgi:hypothetical protein